MKGNHKNPQSVTPVYNRKIARNRLKNSQGNNKIQRAWHKAQIKLYGFKNYIAMRSSKTPRNQRKEVVYQLYNGG